MALLEDMADRNYTAEPVRPWMLVGSRVLLWGAVAAGAFGGVAGCISKGGDDGPAPVVRQSDPTAIPPQVASVAEHTVKLWLEGTSEQEDDIADLFVEPPALPGEVEGRYVLDVHAVAGNRAGDQYWSVTVGADMEQQIEPTEEQVETGEVPDPEHYTLYVEVGIVGDPSRGLVALRTPAVMPAPLGVDPDGDWSSTDEPWESRSEEDPLARTIDEFLDALMAGEGNPDRYVASGNIEPINPAPFDDVQVDEVAVEELEEGVYRVQARVTGTTEVGIDQALAYQLEVRLNGDEYEILSHWGSPTLD